MDPQGGERPQLLGCSEEILTDPLEEPLGLVLPPNAKEVDRQAAEDYGKADATLHGGLPEGDDDQEQAGQDEEHGECQVHLGTEGGAMGICCSLPTPPTSCHHSPIHSAESAVSPLPS